MKGLFLILTVVFLYGCDPVKRHQRLVERYPYVHRDVGQVVYDTTIVYIEQIKHDKTVIMKETTDTIIIEKERLRMQVIRHLDTLYISGECKADTITVIKEIQAPLYKSEEPRQRKRFNWLHWLLFGFGISSVVYFIIFVKS